MGQWLWQVELEQRFSIYVSSVFLPYAGLPNHPSHAAHTVWRQQCTGRDCN